jgi:hypothetical protein
MQKLNSMDKFKEQMHTWVNFALQASEKDSKQFEAMVKSMTKDELCDLLSFLAGYLSATPEGKVTLRSLLS